MLGHGREGVVQAQAQAGAGAGEEQMLVHGHQQLVELELWAQGCQAAPAQLVALAARLAKHQLPRRFRAALLGLFLGRMPSWVRGAGFGACEMLGLVLVLGLELQAVSLTGSWRRHRDHLLLWRSEARCQLVAAVWIGVVGVLEAPRLGLR